VVGAAWRAGEYVDFVIQGRQRPPELLGEIPHPTLVRRVFSAH
jgi:hypothetical protein